MPKDEVVEIKTELKTFKVHAICPECSEGRMQFMGHARLTMPPQYQHACDNCGHKMSLRCRYPDTRHEEVES